MLPGTFEQEYRWKLVDYYLSDTPEDRMFHDNYADDLATENPEAYLEMVYPSSKRINNIVGE